MQFCAGNSFNTDRFRARQRAQRHCASDCGCKSRLSIDGHYARDTNTRTRNPDVSTMDIVLLSIGFFGYQIFSSMQVLGCRFCTCAFRSHVMLLFLHLHSFRRGFHGIRATNFLRIRPFRSRASSGSLAVVFRHVWVWWFPSNPCNTWLLFL